MPAKWKGYISFGLVTIPIILHPSRDREADISFHQIDSRDNARIKYKRVNSLTGKEVPWENIVKGYEYDKETTVPVPSDILQRVAGDSAKTIEIETFISKKEFDFITIDKIYYLTPDKKGEKGYVILRDSLKKSNKIAIAKVLITTKEYISALMPHGEDALILGLLSYDSEMHKLSDFDFPNKPLANYKVSKKEVEIAEQLIDSMTTKWQPEKYVDEYQSVIHKWVEEEVNNKTHPVKKTKSRQPTEIVNFVDLLKKSLAGTKNKKTSVNTKKAVKQLSAKRKNLQKTQRASYTTKH